MKRVISLIALVIMLMCSIGVTVYADTGNSNTGTSLNDIVNQNAQQSATANTDNSASVKKNTDKGIISDLGKAANLSEPNPMVEKSASQMQKLVSIVVQILCYVITFGLTIRCLLDLMYIAIPFMRGFLSNGHIGNPQASTGGMPGQAGMGMNGMGGMGGFGGGLGGFGGGYGGYGRFGGGYGGMGGGMMGGLGGPGMMAQNQTHMPGMAGKIQWVSNAALNAVAAENTGAPDGSTVSPLKMYAKDMAVVVIITPILIVLSVSGVLAQLGFLIGGVLSGVIGSIGGKL